MTTLDAVIGRIVEKEVMHMMPVEYTIEYNSYYEKVSKVELCIIPPY